MDPVSGASADWIYARARQLLQQGWKPSAHRLCLWDGEEKGCSSPVGLQHAAELSQKAAVYINSDSNSRGYLKSHGSHTLEKFINGVARDVEDPEKHISVSRSEAPALERIANSPDPARSRRGPTLRIRHVAPALVRT